MPIVSSCPVCGGWECPLLLDGAEEALTAAGIGPSRAKPSHGRILRCRACGFAFRQFRPAGEDLARLYREADSAVYEREARNRTRTAERHARMVRRRHAAPGAILDVGCASGQFLKAMADAGWETWGVEPSAAEFRLAQETLGTRAVLRNSTLQDAGFSRRFTVITLWDVLEHVTEPVSFLEQCAALLAPGGRLLFTVPDMDSWQARAMRERWPLLLAEHLNYFNPRSLRLCCRRAGLELTKTGRRPASFSVDYILFRLAQHGWPAAAFLRKTARATGLAHLPLPVYLGELVADCRPAAAAQSGADEDSPSRADALARHSPPQAATRRTNRVRSA